MANIGGNMVGVIQVKGEQTTNAIGEKEWQWTNACCQVGWLGKQSGDSKYTTFNAKVEESTHCFLCDYNETIYSLANDKRDKRMIIKDTVYDILLIDNPDEMNEQLEIDLRRVGAWNG
jgi:hypothetical protein